MGGPVPHRSAISGGDREFPWNDSSVPALRIALRSPLLPPKKSM
jgi:hypothetical protein